MSRSQDHGSNGTGSTSLPDTREPEAQTLPGASSTQAEMTKAFADLARGEQQAAGIEAYLTRLESKLEELLASVEAEASDIEATGSTAKESKEKPGPAKE